jgi:hypothetical protein
MTSGRGSTACGDENGVRAGTHDQLAALRAGAATVTIRFIPAETGCLKVFGRPHFGGLFSAKWRCFSSLKYEY